MGLPDRHLAIDANGSQPLSSPGVSRVLQVSGVPLARGVSHTLCDHPGAKSDAHFHLSTKNTSEGSPFTGTLSRQAFRPSQKFI